MLILKEAKLLSIYCVIIFAAVIFGSMAKNRKGRYIAAFVSVISMIGAVYLYLPFHVKNLNQPEDVAFYGARLVTNYREIALTEEQIETILSYVPDLEMKTVLGVEKFRMSGDAVGAYRVELEGKDGWTYLYLDYGEPENSFFIHPKSETWYQINYGTADNLLEYLSGVVEK